MNFESCKLGFSVAALISVGCAAVNSSSGIIEQQRASLVVSQGAPPPPAPVPPNASSITATVLKRTVWPAGTLKSAPAVASDLTHYSLMISVSTVALKETNLESFATPGTNIEVFSLNPLAPELVGKSIQATLRLTGDTQAMRWWISDIQTVP